MPLTWTEGQFQSPMGSKAQLFLFYFMYMDIFKKDAKVISISLLRGGN